jgi:dihydropyrimidinase
MTYDVVIKNGCLITGYGTLDADLAVSGEQISAIGQDLQAHREIDAQGLYVLPGAIDGHVHLDNPKLPPHDPPTADTFRTGTRAAAHGGVTTIIDFAQPRPGESLIDELERRKADAEKVALIDYGLHLNYRDPDPSRLQEIPAVVERGVPSFKLYMAYEGYQLSDTMLLQAMEKIAKSDGLAIMHAEHFEITQHLKKQLEEEGKTGPAWHGAAYPSIMEGEAIHRALALADLAGSPILIFHVSSVEGVRELRLAKERGQAAFGETCPHYLAYTDEIFEKDTIVTQSLMVVPPIRDSRHQAALWQGLKDGSLDIVSTDHCPRPSRETQICQRPGAAGIETRLALLHTLGVESEQISLTQWVRTCCTRPAEIFGLEKKGRLMPGFDADIVLFDPQKTLTYSIDTLHTPIPFSNYEGFTIEGAPVLTMSRGEVIVENGQLAADKGRGRFIERRCAQV